MTEFAKHRGRHIAGVIGGSGDGDTRYYGCVKCGKELPPKPEVVIPEPPVVEPPSA